MTRSIRTCLLALAFSAFAFHPISANEVTTYSYDAQGRLIKTVRSGGPVSGQEKCTDYDTAGNRTARTVTTAGCTPSTGDGGGGSSPSFAINNPPAVYEGGTIVFTVTKIGSGAASVNYATATGTATTADYVTKSGTLSFASNDTTKSISIVTNTDSTFEGNETFNVNLSNATGGATISDAQGVGTILNDETGGCSPVCQ